MYLLFILHRPRGARAWLTRLGTSDPFGLDPTRIVERILAEGFRPVLKSPKTEPWRTIGPVSEVQLDGQTFLVAVSKNAERISVQEMRADAYSA